MEMQKSLKIESTLCSRMEWAARKEQAWKEEEAAFAAWEMAAFAAWEMAARQKLAERKNDKNSS